MPIRVQHLVRVCLPLSILALGACDGTSLKSLRVCKPVVPQVIVDMQSASVSQTKMRLLIEYNEKGDIPGKPQTLRKDARHSSCDTVNSKCVSARARYEVRTEPERAQTIQLRELTGTGSNPVLGIVRWQGPSYQDRVKIACDVERQDTGDACKLEGLEYTSAIEISRHGKQRPRSPNHSNDQCTPLS